MWTWNPGPLLPWETLLVTLGEVCRVMTEGKALIAQPIFFAQRQFLYKIQSGAVLYGFVSVVRAKANRTLNVPLKYPELCPLFLYSFQRPAGCCSFLLPYGPSWVWSLHKKDNKAGPNWIKSQVWNLFFFKTQLSQCKNES